MKKLPEITLNDWMKAEEECFNNRMTPQPKYSVTAMQYGKMRGFSEQTARRKLKEMLDSERATRERWKCDPNHCCYVYTLKK